MAQPWWRAGIEGRGDEPAGPLASCPLEVVVGLMLVRAEIEGRPAGLLVDTGANATVLTPEAAERLGVTTIEAEVTSAGVGGTLIELRVAAVASLALDGYQLGPVNLPILPLDHVNEHLRAAGGPIADGVLGNDVLRRFRVTLDYPARRLELR